MKKRFYTICKWVCRLLAAGLLYAWVCRTVGRPLIPCVFHALTGWYCPGCGVSRMCLALLRLDFGVAFRANRALFLLLPVGCVLAVQMAVRYVRTGERQPTHRQQMVLTGILVLLVLFGVLRNLPVFSYLKPI